MYYDPIEEYSTVERISEYTKRGNTSQDKKNAPLGMPLRLSLIHI